MINTHDFRNAENHALRTFTTRATYHADDGIHT
jgi:hypothetical protein